MRTRPSEPIRRIRRPGFFDGSMMPSLMLDFQAGVLDPRITFTRTTSGTYYKDGLVVTASTNVPRFQSDPVTGESQGLLIEGGITNLVCGSETFATSGGTNNWTDSNISRDGTLRTSPDGSANALRVSASAGNATILNNLSLASASRTFSVWIRRVSGTGNIDLTMDGGTGWTTQSVTSSWRRFQMTATTTAHVGMRIVDSGDEVEIWGAQVEAQAFASSYIPTVAATVARGADSAIMSGSAFSSWYNQHEGTFLTFSSGVPAGYAGGRVLQADNGGGTERIAIGTGASLAVVDNNSTQASISITLAATSALRAAGAYRANDFGFAVNGSAASTDITGTLPTPDRLAIGATSLAASFLNAPIGRIAYWPVRLPNATLQVITA